VEAALIAAVLAPLALHPGIRLTLSALGRPARLALAAMLALALAGQLALGARSFPFTSWHMYASLPHGDATVYEYDAVLRGGRRVPLVPGRFLGPESADRLMEALRRQVERGGPSMEHERALAALAGLYDARHPGDRVEAVLVSERTIAIGSGAEGAPRLLWRVRV
jgi:hypothetical protein